jgi:hypothetical protein
MKKQLFILLPFLLAISAAFLVSHDLHAHAYTLRACHDDSSLSRTNTHGSPLNGSFGKVGAAPNHSNGYYYLDVQTAAACSVGADGLVHAVGRVTANGVGLLRGCTPSSNWGPPCDPRFRLITGTALAGEHPAWGFEYKNASTGTDAFNANGTIACTGGDGSGGSNCPGTPNIVASPGNATVEFRYDGTASQLRFRITNEYDDPIWETATVDIVPCSTCEPA